MALTGLQIQKLLPKTNCKECGSNTCLAFAMKLAGKKAELSQCPYASEEAKLILAAEAEPPIRTVEIGVGDDALKAGGETVMCRHEKTFVHQTGIGLAVRDDMPEGEILHRVRTLARYKLDRVGELLGADLVSVAFRSGSLEHFLETMGRVAAVWPRSLVARSDDPRALEAAAHSFADRRILLASATSASLDDLCRIARETRSALAVAADTMDELAAMAARLREADFRDIVLELRADSLAEHYQSSTIMRRGALKAGLKNLGYPTLHYIDSGDPVDDALEAGIEICKYGGLTIVPDIDPASMVSILALRLGIYTDPQKPIQVEPKVYAIGDPDENSPVFLTTNFSLTYFMISGEIENSGISAWLVIPECEGMSVLTAWAAGKFSGTRIGAFVKASGIEERVKSRRIVIPGYVAQISGELEEALPGWQVLVGPQEAGDIESFVKNVFKAA